MRKTRETNRVPSSPSSRNRLELYLKREAEMLDGGVQSYGIGSRNLARYNTDLADPSGPPSNSSRTDIEALEAATERRRSRRKAVGVVPRDW